MTASELHWIKSSYSSGPEIDDCVEMAATTGEPTWFKSSHSDSSDPNDCVEVGPTSTTIHVRDSKNRLGPQLAFAPGAWTKFVIHAVQVNFGGPRRNP